jgi:hypothetical protein
MTSYIDLVRNINFANQIGAVDAVVTRPAPDDTPIDTRVIWITTRSEDVPIGAEFTRREPNQRVMALRRDQVPTVPRGTIVLAPEQRGGPILGWRVDSFELQEVDNHRVRVLRAPEVDP